MPTKLYGLDHLRALAITLVFLFHYGMFAHPGWIDAVGVFGWTGVDLFFVLSGYLIAGQLFSLIAKGQAVSFPVFFIKRFFRIIPAYAVIVAIYFLVPAFHERESLSPFWKFASFTQNFGLDLRYYGTFSHAWSLCIEEQFYLTLPLLLILFLRQEAGARSFVILPVLFILVITARWLSWQYIVVKQPDELFYIAWYKWIYYPTYTRLDGLLVGVSLAALMQFVPRAASFIQQRGNILLVASVALMCAASFMADGTVPNFAATVFGFAIIAIAFGLLVAGAVSPRSILFRFSSRITSSIAALSYAIYLSHKGIIHLTQELLTYLKIAPDGNWGLLVCIITCLAGAAALRWTVEKPFLHLREKILLYYKNRKQRLMQTA